MQTRPVNASLAIVAALLPLPVLKLLDHLNRGCGDGLCGFASGLLTLGGLVAVTLVFLTRSARRQEEPAFLRVVPLLLWSIGLAPLVV